MLETAIHKTTTQSVPGTTDRPQKILRWEHNERMGGRVPVWDEAKTAKDKITLELESAIHPNKADGFDTALAYTDAARSVNADEAFGFGDLVDMINPLQHLPVIGHVYREITGDEIKPISRIIGGGVFGGGIGAASGLIDTVVEYETGKDMAENTMALVTEGRKPQYRSEIAKSIDTKDTDSVVASLSKSVENDTPNKNLGSALSFADLGHSQNMRQTPPQAQRIPIADGRTAGYKTITLNTAFEAQNLASRLPAREPITELEFDN